MGIIIIIIIIIVLIIELTHSQTMMENSLKINCLSIAPKEPTTNGIIFTFTFQIFGNFTDLDTFLSSLSPSPQSNYLQELQNQWFNKFSSSYQLQQNLVSELP